MMVSSVFTVLVYQIYEQILGVANALQPTHTHFLWIVVKLLPYYNVPICVCV